MLGQLIFVKRLHKITPGILKYKRLENFDTLKWFVDELHGGACELLDEAPASRSGFACQKELVELSLIVGVRGLIVEVYIHHNIARRILDCDFLLRLGAP